MNEEARAQLLAELSQRLSDMDLATLQQLDRLMRTAEAPPALPTAVAVTGNSPAPAAVSRRRFLTGVAAGGAGALLCAAGGGAAALTALRAENVTLRGLLSFYESLEGVGIDQIVQAGIGLAGGVLHGIESGATALRQGLETAETAVGKFAAVFPTIRRGIEGAEGLVSALSARLAALEAAAGRALDRVKPITSALGGAFDQALTLLPDTLETRVRGLLARAEDIITDIPETVQGINRGLLEPLRNNWFGEAAEQRLESTLIEPLRTGLFDPLEAQLDDLARFADAWQNNLVGPVQAAIARRDGIRAQIAAFKQTNGLHAP